MSTGWGDVDRWTRVWLVASIVLGASYIAAALWIPFYLGSTSTQTVALVGGKVVTTSSGGGDVSSTLIHVNGLKILAIVALPLLGALVATWSIVDRRRRSRRGVGTVTWSVIAALGALALLGVFTIGPFIAPVPLCLLVAALRVNETGQTPQLR